MKRDFICILCPNGCDIRCTLVDGAIAEIEGAGCPRGAEYVQEEIYHPRRNIATSLLVRRGELPLVSVRLDQSIPKDRIFDVMTALRPLTLDAPVRAGTIVVRDILGLGANVIATRTVAKRD